MWYLHVFSFLVLFIRLSLMVSISLLYHVLSGEIIKITWTLQLRDLKDSKEAVYGTLDAWVAWEENFPIALIRRALNILEKEQEWHRIVQVGAVSDLYCYLSSFSVSHSILRW